MKIRLAGAEFFFHADGRTVRNDEANSRFSQFCEGTLNCYTGVSRLVDIAAGGDFLGLCYQKNSYKYVSDFGRLRSYDRLKLRIEGKDY